MSSAGQEIKRIRLERGISQNQLAKSAGISQAGLSAIENTTKSPNIDTLGRIANVLGVSTDYLLGRTDVERPTIDLEKAGILPLPEMMDIPLVGTIACGTPILASQNIEDYLQAPAYTHATFALRCQGDSMINARIFDGDVVFIRQQDDVDDGDIAAVLIGEEATLKRVRKLPAKLVLSPCNPLYDDIIYTGSDLDRVRILGKAVYFVSAVK